MKICPKCGAEHNLHGTFCSRTCSNSRVFSKESREKKSRAAKRYVAENKDLISLRRKNRSKRGAGKWSEEIKQLRRNKREHRLRTVPFEELNKTERRDFLLIEQNMKCAGGCGITERWNGKYLRFELDHIDGNRQREDRSNLRLICPNCHQQTPTYKGRNCKDKKVTDDQIAKCAIKSSSIYECLKLLNMSKHGKNYNRVRRVVKEFNLSVSFVV